METTQAMPEWKAAADEIWAMLRESQKEAVQWRKEAEERQRKADIQWRLEAEKRQREAEERQREAEERRKEAEERRKEADLQIERIRKIQEETDRIVRENAIQMKETDKQLEKQLGKLGNRFGEMVEYMVMPNLIDKFRELGFVFTKAYPHATIKDKENRIITEIDITLENGDKVMIVEVKSKPSIEDIKDHVERMGKVRRHADLHGDKRKFLGAVAGMVINGNERDFALKNGFYVVEPSGETFSITVPEGDYQAREW